MSLGAGFKFVDRDKDSDRDKDKAREKNRDLDRLLPGYKSKDKDDSSSRWKISEDISREVTGHFHSWTSMIEDSLCYVDAPATDTSSLVVSNENPQDGADSHRRTNATEQRKGPYQLLIKERMMGIYLAIYINRDIRNLIKGTYATLRCGQNNLLG
jgi:hypothetical protein